MTLDPEEEEEDKEVSSIIGTSLRCLFFLATILYFKKSVSSLFLSLRTKGNKEKLIASIDRFFRPGGRGGGRRTAGAAALIWMDPAQEDAADRR